MKFPDFDNKPRPIQQIMIDYTMTSLKKHEAALFALFLIIVVPSTAHAYIDPGTGSYLVQILIAIFAGGAFILRTFWANIKGMFSKKTKETESDAISNNVVADKDEKIS